MAHRIGGAVAAIVLVAGPAQGIEVQRSVEVAASAEEVWSVIGEVCSIADWHPVIASCIVEDEVDALFRLLQTEDGGQIHEQILEIDDSARYYTYSILEGPLPVRGYLSTLSVGPGEEDGSAVVVWQSDFSSLGVGEEEAATIIGGIYDAGLEGIQERFAP